MIFDSSEPSNTVLNGCSSLASENDQLYLCLLFTVHVRLFFLWWVTRPILALNCLLQTEQVNFEDDDSDYDPLALALRSLHFCSALQTLCFYTSLCSLFPGLWWYFELTKRGFYCILIAFCSGHFGSAYPLEGLHRRLILVAARQAFWWHDQSIVAVQTSEEYVCFAFLPSSGLLYLGSCLATWSSGVFSDITYGSG